MDDLIVGALILAMVSLFIYFLTKICVIKMEEITDETKKEHDKILKAMEEISNISKL